MAEDGIDSMLQKKKIQHITWQVGACSSNMQENLPVITMPEGAWSFTGFCRAEPQPLTQIQHARHSSDDPTVQPHQALLLRLC